jgi:hypothetical protein
MMPIAGFLMGLFGRAPPPDSAGDPAGVKDLIENRISFIGISAYAPLTGPGFAPKELENSAFNIKVSRVGGPGGARPRLLLPNLWRRRWL